MARLDTAQRKRMPKSEFGEPGKRAYPMPDRSHAANAKARASEMEHKGKLSEAAKAKIDEKADRVLGEKGHKMDHERPKAEERREDRKEDRKKGEKPEHHHEHHHENETHHHAHVHHHTGGETHHHTHGEAMKAMHKDLAKERKHVKET
jgi:hypothetical protein